METKLLNTKNELWQQKKKKKCKTKLIYNKKVIHVFNPRVYIYKYVKVDNNLYFRIKVFHNSYGNQMSPHATEAVI